MTDRFATTLSEFRAQRFERPLATRHALCWYPSAKLRVICVWGAFGHADADMLVAALADELAHGVAPIPSLIDLTSVVRLEHAALAAIFRLIGENADDSRTAIRRSAFVHRPGNEMATAAVAGYTKLLERTAPHSHIGLERPVPTDHFATLEDGLCWLGFAEPAAAVAADIRRLKDHIVPRFAVLEAFERAVEANLADPSADKVARTLATSTRTLQRELRAIGTTFTEQVRRVRVARAQTLLLETQLTVAAIAERVGYATAHALRSAFRIETSASPAAWRVSQSRGE